MIVVYLHACSRCGKACETKDVEVTFEGKGEVTHTFTFKTCEACFHKTMSELARVHPVFQAMKAVDIPPIIAHETMTFLLNKLYNDGEDGEGEDPNGEAA